MMMRKFLAAFAALFLIFVLLTGCAGGNLIQPINGVGRGSTGDIFRTDQVDVRVLSAQSVQSISGYNAREAEQLVDIKVRLRNHTDGEISLQDTDFQLLWGTDGFADPLVAAGNAGMAPSEITLRAGETAEYHFVYPVAQLVTQFSLCFADAQAHGVTSQAQNIFYVDFSL